ncbi:hypothetical protein JRO89_XS07G0011500 [Xanthoceras sorbifolium]|uniref:Dehydrin n=1 Tax=Xanthoceras sorbifolium TaxID=99658 RepID=A0ABQ8HRX7_9ROSI|nr:hypothetical protein JRO89_XS07G0011500 [Xanthoceras sorbifolium]
MAEEHHQKSSSHEFEPKVAGEGTVETTDRGLFDFLGKKKEEKPQDQEVINTTAAEFDQKVQVSEQHEPPKVEEGKNFTDLLEKVEEEKPEEKKPGLLQKLHRSGSSSSSSVTVPVEVIHQEPVPHQPEEKKGLMDKIKDKLPGQHKKPEEVPPTTTSAPPPPPPHAAEHATPEPAEKKGIFEKIKEKIPGYHPKTEEEKEKEKERA